MVMGEPASVMLEGKVSGFRGRGRGGYLLDSADFGDEAALPKGGEGRNAGGHDGEGEDSGNLHYDDLVEDCGVEGIE